MPHPNAPKSAPFKSIKATEAVWERLRAHQRAFVDAGASSLPEPLRARVQAASLDAVGRQKAVGLSGVIEVALDALDAALAADGENR